MTKLEQLKQEMLDARKAYDTFLQNNSTTDENSDPLFIGVNQRSFELTKENFNEMERLTQNVKDTHSAYIQEYQNNLK